MSHCYDTDQAENRINIYQPRLLTGISATEEVQLGLDAAGPLLTEPDAERVYAAAAHVRAAVLSLRLAEALLGEVNEALRLRTEAARETSHATMAP